MPNFFENGVSKADILRFFKFSKWLLPPLSWIFEIGKFYWLFGWRRSRRISTPTFVKIGQSVVKVLRLFVFFQDGGRHRLGLLNLQNFIRWRCSEVPYASLYQISSKSWFFVAEVLQFFKFSKWPPPPYWIFEITKFYWFFGPEVETHQHAKFCQNRSIGCEDIKIFQFFKMAAVRHLGFV